MCGGVGRDSFVLLVEANVFRVLGCCAIDVPIEAQTGPSPPAVSHCLISLSCCDASTYASCPCAFRGLLLVDRQLVVRIQEAGECLDVPHFLWNASSQYWDVVFEVALDVQLMRLGYYMAFKLICCVKICG